MTDTDDILAANHAYYEALSARDIESMTRLWICTDADLNIAPPVRPVMHAGWNDIRSGYLEFWATLSELTVAMESPEVRINGNTAWLHGIEVSRRRLRDGSSEGSRNAGTSIFVRHGGQWKMIFHHATALV